MRSAERDASVTSPSNPKIQTPPTMRNLVYLNIGGKIFTTFQHTLVQHDSIFPYLLKIKDLSPFYDKQGNIYIDRQPKYFELIINALRRQDNVIQIPEDADRQFVKNLQQEIDYYGYTRSLTIQVGPPCVPPTVLERFDLWKSKMWSLLYTDTFNEDYLHGFFIGFLLMCIYMSWMFHSFVKFSGYNQLFPFTFWPLHLAFGLGIVWIVLLYFMDKRKSPVHTSIGGYIIFATLMAAFWLYFRLIFNKFYHYHYSLPYYSWIGVMFLFASILAIGFFWSVGYVVFYYTIGCRVGWNQVWNQFQQDIQDIPLVFFFTGIPIWAYSLFGSILYADGIYFVRLWVVLLPMIIHVIAWCLFGIFFYNNSYQDVTEKWLFANLSRCGLGLGWTLVAFVFNFGPILKFGALDVILTIAFYEAWGSQYP